MSKAQRLLNVVKSDDIDKTYKNEGGTSRWILCHQATSLWLYQAAYGQLPPLETVANAQGFVNSLLKWRLALQQSKTIHANTGLKVRNTGTLLPPASVVLFVQDHNVEHSCVAKSSQIIAGYNQTDWFAETYSPKGVMGRYTEHDTRDIKWKAKDKHVAERGDNKYRLYAVHAGDAVTAAQSFFPAPL